MPVDFEELELPFDDVAGCADHHVGHLVAGLAERAAASPVPVVDVPVCRIARDPLGTFPCCPLCGGELRPEHAHYRCACGWRDSCCD